MKVRRGNIELKTVRRMLASLCCWCLLRDTTASFQEDFENFGDMGCLDYVLKMTYMEGPTVPNVLTTTDGHANS